MPELPDPNGAASGFGIWALAGAGSLVSGATEHPAPVFPGRDGSPSRPRRVQRRNSSNAERRGKRTCFRLGVRTFVPPLKRGGDTSARCPYRTGLRTTVVGASRRDARAACSGAIRRTRKGVARGLVFDWGFARSFRP